MYELFRIFMLPVICAAVIFSEIITCNVNESFNFPAVIKVNVAKLYKAEFREKEIDENKEENISKDDAELIALITMAEAEGECEKGKRLVIDTILNRVDSEYFPNTVHEVIYQPGQFSSVWNGRVNRCEVREDIYSLVINEAETRTNHDVIFFTAGRYSCYGTPMFQVENHYFSSWD